MRILTGIATAGVMLLVFGVMILAIFSFARFYLNTIYDAVRMSETGQI
jgi:hypothetical protein